VPLLTRLFVLGEAVSGSVFSGVTADTFTGMFNEIKTLIPIMIPVAVTYMAIRKGWSFLMSILKKA